MIVRTKKSKENPYYMKNRTAPNDPRLTWKAKGIHDYLMSKPDNWQANITELTNASADGADAVRAGVNELIKFGYMARVRIIDKAGKILAWELQTYESPDLNPHWKEPDRDFPDVAKPDVGNPTLINNDHLKNNDLSNKKIASAAQPPAEPEPKKPKRQPAKMTPNADAIYERYLLDRKEGEPGQAINTGQAKAGAIALDKLGWNPDQTSEAYWKCRRDKWHSTHDLTLQYIGRYISILLGKAKTYGTASSSPGDSDKWKQTFILDDSEDIDNKVWGF